MLLYAQISGRTNLRSIESDLRVLDSTWAELGLKSVARSTLAYANEHRPAAIFESLFYVLFRQCRALSAGQDFSFKNPLHAIDTTSIAMCLELFDWAKFRTQKGAFRLHVDLDIRSQIPDLLDCTDGKTHEVTVAQEMDFSAYVRGTIFVMDRGYNDYALLHRIKDAGHHFVIRRKKNAQTFVLRLHRLAKGAGVLKDERVAFALGTAQERYPDDLRQVTFADAEGEVYEYLTDEFRLSAANIAEIYKRRWDIETFFRWIKQNLKIKTFLGTSKNAVLTQVWVAMIYFLLLKWLAYCINFRGSLTEIARKLARACLHPLQLVEVLCCSERGLQRLRRAREGPQLCLF
jgi:transposase